LDVPSHLLKHTTSPMRENRTEKKYIKNEYSGQLLCVETCEKGEFFEKLQAKK